MYVMYVCMYSTNQSTGLDNNGKNMISVIL